MAARNALLLAMASCLLAAWLHGHPGSSSLSGTKFFEWLKVVLTEALPNITEYTETFTWMGAYGAVHI
jgi:hypothetical protein